MQNTAPQHERTEKKPERPPVPETKKDKDVRLVFIVNGEAFTLEAKQNWHLRKAVEAALKENGNEGRPLTDWTANWNNQPLDLDKKIEDYSFPEGSEIFLSLNAGQGGNQNC